MYGNMDMPVEKARNMEDRKLNIGVGGHGAVAVAVQGLFIGFEFARG